MKLYIPKDMFDNYRPTRLFLCGTNKKRIGELNHYETSLTGKWNQYSELNFAIDRTYVDILTGETKVNPLFDKAEGLRMVLVEGMGYFTIQDQETTLSDKDIKTLTCFSSEYHTANKYLENFYINTGDENSKEVVYLSSIYGDGYSIDERYKLATGEFDAYESYYIQQYSDTDSYIYEQVQVATAEEYEEYISKNSDPDAQPHEKLYVRKYPNVRFYWPSKPELSLLHLIFEKIPEWSIGNVDVGLWRQERKFEQDRIAVYDFLTNDIVDTFKCVVEWDTLENKVNFYEEADDGITDNGAVQSRFETDIYVSKDNLASEISINYSTDNIKTKLKVSGSNDFDIREVNLGKNYIMNLDYYYDDEWMEPELKEAYGKYLKKVELYAPQYTDAMQGWVSSYNQWNDLMNAVPIEGNVVLVGDEFKKLYCVYTPIYEEGADQDAINAAIDTAITSLTEKLKIYRVNEDVDADVTDNILLRLKNNGGDTATIRIYNNGTESEPEYLIKTIIVSATNGLESASKPESEPTLRQWVAGATSVDNTGPGGMSNLKEFKVSYIGTMGAYFVLAKDEKMKENIEDYGINLLREKQKIYTTIFQTQTEAMYSQEKYQCTASDNEPKEPVAEGTRWFDTDSNPPTLYKRTVADSNASFEDRWTSVETDANAADLENYQRYIDNYEKLVNVQEVLIAKERDAEYLLDGYAVPNMLIDANNIVSDEPFYIAACNYFKTDAIVGTLNSDYNKKEDGTLNIKDVIPIYSFTTPFAEGKFAVYLHGNIPYVSYAQSQGIYQSKMNVLAQLTELENSFTKEQFIALSPLIREDEYIDDNFLLTGYESEEERLEICKELMEAASKELKTLSKPSLEFSMTMANILALPEFASITSQFELGKFIRIELRPGIVKRARLLEFTINFDDLSDFSCTFGNLITTKSEIDLHAELLQQAIKAGKTVATASSDWQRAVDKSNKLENAIANGLQDAALQIGRANGQAISWDDTGMHFRKYRDGSTTEFEPEEMAIINNALVATNDNWRTSKAAFGKYTINGETRWGPIAEYVTADTIEGKFISGGSIEIGEGDTKFIVDKDGNVSIQAGGKDKYASNSAMQIIDDAYRYRVELSYNKSTVFANAGDDCTITCTIYDNRNQKDATEDFIKQGAKFSWIRASSSDDAKWNSDHADQNTNKIVITRGDIYKNAQFSCQIKIDEANLPSDDTQQS